MKSALVCGGGGFIGAHLVRRLKDEGFSVCAVDLRYPDFGPSVADEFVIGDLREADLVKHVLQRGFDHVYQLAADMGGAGYLFTGDNDASVMHNSVLINLNILNALRSGRSRVFFSSSACVYPEYNQLDPQNPRTPEDSVYPACPDSDYGWEKLFSERLYEAHARNSRIDVRIARYHNIFGPDCAWDNGREKSPAAICRKVAQTPDGGEVEVWGDGKQTRSFLYIEDCLDATRRLMDGDWSGPVNIGSEELVTIDELAALVGEIAGKSFSIKHVQGPQGVRGRTSDNRLIAARLGWRPRFCLRRGLELTYRWIESQVLEKAA